MTRRLNTQDRGILSFRPNIAYVEPDQQPGEITPITPDAPKLENIIKQRAEITQLARAVESLAIATQAKADEKAKGMKIALDPRADYDAIQAMKRLHPTANPLEITYEQYRACKENMYEKGIALGKQGIVSQEDINKASKSIATGNGITQLGGYNTPAASNGGLRPELNKKAQVIEPIDLDEFQMNLMCMLVNKLWKMFIRPIIPLPGLPGSLCKENKKITEKIAEEKKQSENPPTIPTEIEI